MSDSVSFTALAGAVRDIINESGGAAIMTREGWIDAVKQEDPALKECPSRIFDHFTCPLPRRQGLRSGLYNEECASVLVVFDPQVHPDITSASEHCERSGLPDDVMIALAEAGIEPLEDALVVA